MEKVELSDLKKRKVLDLSGSEYVGLGHKLKGHAVSEEDLKHLKIKNIQLKSSYIVQPGHGRASGSGMNRIADIDSQPVDVYPSDELDKFLIPFYTAFEESRDSINATLAALPEELGKTALKKWGLVEETAKLVKEDVEKVVHAMEKKVGEQMALNDTQAKVIEAQKRRIDEQEKRLKALEEHMAKLLKNS